MIGSWLARALRERGDEVLILTRRRARTPDAITWDPKRKVSDLQRLEGLHAIVQLSGAPLADRPWTRQRRTVLWDSRIEATQTLRQSLSELDRPPKVWVGAGGIGFYGDRDEAVLDESMPAGTGFLADLAVAWEESQLQAAEALDARGAVLRMSIVLSPSGGAFPLMVKPFQMGIGGWLGNGRQYTSWISIRDAVAAFLHLIDDPSSQGPFNGTIPEPTPNKEWFRALGRVLHRPVMTHAPKWALRGALGELADDLFLASVRATPRKLLDAGFTFRDADAEATFAWLVDALSEAAR